MMIVVPAFGGGVFAYEVPGGAVQFILISLAAFAIYGLALGYFFTGTVKEGRGSDVGSTRREFVRRAGIYAFVGLIRWPDRIPRSEFLDQKYWLTSHYQWLIPHTGSAIYRDHSK